MRRLLTRVLLLAPLPGSIGQAACHKRELNSFSIRLEPGTEFSRMVFYLTAKDGSILYVGRDKYENEELIKWGWPEDVWFHVDNVSSPHVYVRMPSGKTMDDLSPDAIRDAAQWCKQGSIEGCKLGTCVIIYTPWSNLRKDGSMAAGQVSFHSDKLVRKYSVLEKDKETLRRLEKTREERAPDFAAERKQRDDEERARLKAEHRDRTKAEKELAEARKKEKDARSYDSLFKKGGAAGGAGDGDDAAGMGLDVKPSEDASASVAFEEGFM